MKKIIRTENNDAVLFTKNDITKILDSCVDSYQFKNDELSYTDDDDDETIVLRKYHIRGKIYYRLKVDLQPDDSDSDEMYESLCEDEIISQKKNDKVFLFTLNEWLGIVVVRQK